jgi:uncharacterized damage-inducible protein DinB
MVTPKALALQALRHTTTALTRCLAQFPKDHWQDSAGGAAKSAEAVLAHVLQAERFWRLNIGVPVAPGEVPPRRRGRGDSPADQIERFRQLRRRLNEILEASPDAFFENPVPTCRYPQYATGAALCLYIARHDYYHDGQLRMLEMLFTG